MPCLFLNQCGHWIFLTTGIVNPYVVLNNEDGLFSKFAFYQALIIPHEKLDINKRGKKRIFAKSLFPFSKFKLDKTIKRECFQKKSFIKTAQ